MNFNRARHALAQLRTGIINHDAQPIDQRGAEIRRFDRFGGKFSFGRNEAHFAVIRMVGLRVGKNLDLFAGMDIAKVAFGDIGSNPDGIVKGNRQDRIARRDNRPRFLSRVMTTPSEGEWISPSARSVLDEASCACAR